MIICLYKSEFWFSIEQCGSWLGICGNKKNLAGGDQQGYEGSINN